MNELQRKERKKKGGAKEITAVVFKLKLEHAKSEG